MKKRYIFLTLTLCFFGVINTYAQVPSYVPTSGLVSFWPFNGNGNDASSNNNHLTAVGPTLTSDSCGSSNKAYTFSSLNDYMYPTKSYSATNVLTYSIWIKSNSTVGSNSTYSGQVIHFNNGRITHGGTWCKTLWVNTSGVTFYTYQSGQVTHTVNTNILDNNWHHIVVTMDGNGSKIYIDGTYRSTKPSQNSGQVFTGYYRIGGLAHTSTLARSLIGDYDDIGIWSRVLSASEIAGLYTANCCTATSSTDTIISCGAYTWTNGVTYTSSNNTAKDTFVNAAGCDSIVTLNLTINGIPANGLIGYYPFNSNANDESSNGNNGTVNGATLTTDRFGVSNKAYFFDGSNDNISLSPINVSQAVTLSVWVKNKKTSGNWRGLVTTQNNNTQGFLLQDASGSLKYDWTVSNGSGYYDLYNSTLIDTSKWVHIVGVITSDSMMIYYNGNLESERAIGSRSLASTANLWFGSRYSSEYFNGKLDDIAIWNRALTSSEIAGLYTANCCTTTSSTDTIISCGAYTWTNGVTYTTSNNTATDTFMNALGCDSIVTLNLTVLPPATIYIGSSNISSDTVICSNQNIALRYDTSNQTSSGSAASISGYAFLGSYGVNNYYVSNSASNWSTANQSAISNGGHLADISSSGENSFLASKISTYSWIGYNDVASEGSFVWSSGSQSTYTNWRSNEPNNGGGNEDHTILWPNQEWSDWNGSTYHILEVSTISVLWSTGETSIEINVSPDTSTVYWVSSGGCRDSMTITVQDVIKPTVVTQNLTVSLDASGAGSVTATQVDNGSTDNCTIATRTLSKLSFDCSNVGTNTVYLIVTDANGNVDSASAVITVQDVIKPTVLTQNLTVSLDASGAGSLTATQVDNGSTDNCTIATRTLSKSSFDCSNVGTNTIYLIVTDVNGNVDSASAVITVEDNIKPTVVTQNVTVSLDASGAGSVTVADIDNGSTDNCSIASRTLSKSSFDCSEVGSNTIYLIVTDVNGNIDSASAVVTVQDTIKPTVLTQNVTVSLDASGAVSIAVADIDNGSTDNCIIASRALSKSSFDCFEVGSNSIFLVVTDVNGNKDSTSATIIVQDTIKPIVVTQPVTVSLDASGAGSVTVADIDNGSTDNCSIATRTL
ncbi:LamG domain-containing protein, partial [Bacteroidia bacterium]|nr:LamG domain-containing protein [Bacteroidia bacterium]